MLLISNSRCHDHIYSISRKMIWNPSLEDRSYKLNLSEMIDIYIQRSVGLDTSVAEEEEEKEGYIMVGVNLHQKLILIYMKKLRHGKKIMLPLPHGWNEKEKTK